MSEFLFGLIVGALIIFGAVACSDSSSPTNRYNIIEIEGMTCIENRGGGHLTCNWDEWEKE